MYTPSEVAAWLGIAPVTLRKWAIEFRFWLSPCATQVSRGVARRYTDADLIVLSEIHGYLARNFTYAEIQTFFRHQPAAEIVTTSPHHRLAMPLLTPADAVAMPGDPVRLAADAAVARRIKEP
jgi:DNA-binding transcriptional MerR regulator